MDEPPPGWKRITLTIDTEVETTLVVMLLNDAGKAESRARKVERSRPNTKLSRAARANADKKLDALNVFNTARGMPPRTPDEVVKPFL